FRIAAEICPHGFSHVGHSRHGRRRHAAGEFTNTRPNAHDPFHRTVRRHIEGATARSRARRTDCRRSEAGRAPANGKRPGLRPAFLLVFPTLTEPERAPSRTAPR